MLLALLALWCASTPALLVGGSDVCVTAEVRFGAGTFPFSNVAATTSPEGQSFAACDCFGTTGIANDV
jgi:hypothetical protein